MKLKSMINFPIDNSRGMKEMKKDIKILINRLENGQAVAALNNDRQLVALYTQLVNALETLLEKY